MYREIARKYCARGYYSGQEELFDILRDIYTRETIELILEAMMDLEEEYDGDYYEEPDEDEDEFERACERAREREEELLDAHWRGELDEEDEEDDCDEEDY